MSQTEPTVSVIMPCYNQGQYLDEAVESVLAQTCRSFEIIVINDGSTDAETVNLLQNYQKPDVRIIHTENRGPSAARNAGIQQAIGHYILPLDADDRIQPTYLEKAVEILDHNPNVGIVYSQAEFFGAKTGLCDLPTYSFPEILLGNMIFNSSFYRKVDWEKIGGYNENMVYGWEDYDFWLSILELDRDVVQIPAPLYLYRQVPNSRSDRLSRDRQITSYAQIFHNHPRLYSDHISTLFQHIFEMREDVHQTHTHFGKTQTELLQVQTELLQVQSELVGVQGKVAYYQTLVAAMQSSKFWKLRNQWIKLQNRLGLKTDDVLTEASNSHPSSRSSGTTLTSSSGMIQKLRKLIKVWQERGTRGLLRFLYQRGRERLKGQFTYDKWVKQHSLTRLDILAARREIAQWQHQPKFSVILPVYDVEAKWLEKAIQSVLNQIYPNWELCIADDTSSQAHIKPLLTRYSKHDSRIKVVFRPQNGNIVAASNSALELATGDYIALLDHDDELAIDALFETAKLINHHPDADFIYSDEDKMDTQGKRLDPFFKPDWSPDYFHACMYTCHLGVYRTHLIREIGGFRAGYDGSQDYDLVLRVVEKTKSVYHIPKILYHWRIIPASVTSGEQAKPWAYIAARKALEASLTASPYPGWVEETPRAGFWRVRRQIIGQPLVSIIIPSAGKVIDTPDGPLNVLENCIRSIQQCSTYRNVEIVVVDGYDIPESTLEILTQPSTEAALPIQLVRCAEPFNFAQRINLGAAKSTGEFLLLLNDDTEVITPDWLESLLEFAQQVEIGAVGAKLLFPDGKIQHAGVMVLNGNAGHAYHGFDGDHPGYFCSNLVNRNYLAVTAACLMMRRELFHQLGGMDEQFPLNYNDVDLCLKAHQAGYRNVVTPYAQLTHYESASREAGLRPKEWETLNHKWGNYLKTLGKDPYYNPNLSHRTATFELS